MFHFAALIGHQGRDSDFDCDSEQDDEATIAAQEREAGDDSAAVQEEIDQLRADQEVPIEELRRQYAGVAALTDDDGCLLYTSPSPRDRQKSRMPSSA